MGSGKTTFAFQMFNDNSTPDKMLKRYIYATPRLKEIERACQTVEGRTFNEPDGKYCEGSKYRHFIELLREGRDIATSHALIELCDDEAIGLIQSQGYTLVIDEAPSVFKSIPLCDEDKEMLLESGYITVEDGTNKLTWTKADYSKRGAFNELREQLEKPGICYADGENSIVHTMTPSFWTAFSDVYMMMYLYDGQFVKAYFELYEIEVEKYAVSNGELTAYNAHNENRAAQHQLIQFKQVKARVGEGVYDLSSNKMEKKMTAEQFEEIKKEMYAFARTTKQADILWTCVSSCESKLTANGYAKAYISYTERATNEYKDRTLLMYIGNRFINPNDRKFFSRRGITLNEELYAVSEVLQWVYRSAIRDGKQVRIYMPAKRMRDLISKWATNAI